MSEQEIGLLAAITKHCGQMTITFCLDRVPTERISWLSTWSVVRRTFEECRTRMGNLAGVQVLSELLPRDPKKNRFVESSVLQHLEKFWAEPKEYRGKRGD